MPSVVAGAEWSDPGSPGETLGLIGVSLPIPLWNKGGGNSAAALSEADAAAAGAREARLTARASLATAEVRLAEAAERARLSRDSLSLPPVACGNRRLSPTRLARPESCL